MRPGRAPAEPRRPHVFDPSATGCPSTTASTSSCAAAPRTGTSSSASGPPTQVVIQPRLDVPVLAPDGDAGLDPAAAPARPAASRPGRSLATATCRSASGCASAGAAVALRRLDPADPASTSVTFGDWLAAPRPEPSAPSSASGTSSPCRRSTSPAAEASLALAAKVFRVGLLDRADAGDIGWSTVPLAELHGEHRRPGPRGRGRRDRCSVAGHRGRSRRRAAGSFSWRAERQARGRRRCRRRRPASGGRRRSGPSTAEPALASGSDRRRSSTSTWSSTARSPTSPSPPASTRPSSSSSTARVSSGLDRQASAWPSRCPAADSYIDQGPARAGRALHRALWPSSSRLPATARLLDAVVTRERAATFRARPGRGRLRPSAATRRTRAVPRRRLVRHGLAGDDGGGGAQRPDGRCRRRWLSLGHTRCRGPPDCEGAGT